jgi:hypothetical protein
MTALAKIRAFAAPRPAAAICELCAAGFDLSHDHLIEPDHRRLLCVCRPCALLFPSSGEGRRLRIDSRVCRLSDLRLDDDTWAALGVPVGLAFFLVKRPSRDVIATFPSRAGTLESSVPRSAWERVCEVAPAVARLVPETEALLVSRTTRRHRYFQVSIDHCYELAGLLRDVTGPMSMADPQIVESFLAALEDRADER